MRSVIDANAIFAENCCSWWEQPFFFVLCENKLRIEWVRREPSISRSVIKLLFLLLRRTSTIVTDSQRIYKNQHFVLFSILFSIKMLEVLGALVDAQR